MPSESILPIVLGSGLGLVAALGILASEVLAHRFVPKGAPLDVVLRLAVFGLIVLAVSELIGTYFGDFVRAHALGFWLAFCGGFILPPFVVRVLAKRSERQSAA